MTWLIFLIIVFFLVIMHLSSHVNECRRILYRLKRNHDKSLWTRIDFPSLHSPHVWYFLINSNHFHFNFDLFNFEVQSRLDLDGPIFLGANWFLEAAFSNCCALLSNSRDSHTRLIHSTPFDESFMREQTWRLRGPQPKISKWYRNWAELRPMKEEVARFGSQKFSRVGGWLVW